jgi:hypothetical protein
MRPFPSVFAMDCRCPRRRSKKGDGVNHESLTLPDLGFGSVIVLRKLSKALPKPPN